MYQDVDNCVGVSTVYDLAEGEPRSLGLLLAQLVPAGLRHQETC
jgi:hypothetical protein